MSTPVLNFLLGIALWLVGLWIALRLVSKGPDGNGQVPRAILIAGCLLSSFVAFGVVGLSLISLLLSNQGH